MNKKTLKKGLNVFSEQFIYVSATILSSGVHFLYSILVKMKIEPIEYGIYSTCILLQTYMVYLQLGTLNAFNRDYPQLIGANKQEEAKRYRDTVFSFLLIVFSVAIMIITVLIFIFKEMFDLDERYVFGLIFCAIITGLTIIENFGNYRRRIDGGFSFVSYITLLELVAVPLGLVLVRLLGYYSIYVTSIVSMLIGIIAYYRSSYADVTFGVDKRIVKDILISGMPLLINGLIWTVVNSVDKFVILGFINTEALGLYSIAQNAFSYMVLIPSAMSQLFYVKMGKCYGEEKNVKKLYNISLKYTCILTFITSVIALFAFYLFPMLVEVIMPQYAAGIPSAQILIIGVSIYAATMVNGNILTILKKNRIIVINSILMCIFNAVCSVLLVSIFEAKIEYVAIGTSLSYTIVAIFILCQIRKCTDCSVGSLLKGSVFPICIALLPGVLIYNTGINKIIGLVLSLIFVALVFFAVNYKSLKEFFKKG